eukprot:5709433-Pleurochrysis_carterae.AAC.1
MSSVQSEIMTVDKYNDMAQTTPTSVYMYRVTLSRYRPSRRSLVYGAPPPAARGILLWHAIQADAYELGRPQQFGDIVEAWTKLIPGSAVAIKRSQFAAW